MRTRVVYIPSVEGKLSNICYFDVNKAVQYAFRKSTRKCGVFKFREMVSNEAKLLDTVIDTLRKLGNGLDPEVTLDNRQCLVLIDEALAGLNKIYETY